MYSQKGNNITGARCTRQKTFTQKSILFFASFCCVPVISLIWTTNTTDGVLQMLSLCMQGRIFLKIQPTTFRRIWPKFLKKWLKHSQGAVVAENRGQTWAQHPQIPLSTLFIWPYLLIFTFSTFFWFFGVFPSFAWRDNSDWFVLSRGW